jgi:Ca2+-binding RTX toxin-like protein
MANFFSASNGGLNFNTSDLDDWRLATGSYNGSTATLRGASGQTYTMSGSFQSATTAGFPTSGVIDSILISNSSGSALNTMTALNVNASTFYGAMNAGDVMGAYAILTAGSDVLTGGSAADYLRAGDGIDTMFGNDGADTLEGQAGDDLVISGGGADLLVGGFGFDRLFGGLANDTLVGRDDADTLAGQEGNDHLFEEAGDGLLDGGEGDDILVAGAGSDLLIGGAGNDHLYGESDVDFLYGGDGADVLNGGLGADYMHGGSGADIFMVGIGEGADWIADFNFAEGDRVYAAKGVGFGATTYGNFTVLDFGGGATIGLAGVSTTTNATSWVVFY